MTHPMTAQRLDEISALFNRPVPGRSEKLWLSDQADRWERICEVQLEVLAGYRKMADLVEAGEPVPYDLLQELRGNAGWLIGQFTIHQGDLAKLLDSFDRRLMLMGAIKR